MQYLVDPDARSKGVALFEHAAHFAIRQGRTLTMTLLSLQSDREKEFGIIFPPVRDYGKSRYYSLAIREKSGSQKVHPDFRGIYMTPIANI